MFAGEKEDLFEDVPEVFRPVAKEFGRDLFALVMNAGMAAQAAEVLGVVVARTQSHEAHHALTMLVRIFNQLSSDYVRKMGWDDAEVARCESGIKAAWAGKIAVAPAGIILPS